MAKSPLGLLSAALAAAAVYSACQALVAFVAPSAPSTLRAGAEHGFASRVALNARGGGEYDVSDADIEKFYQDTISGTGGNPAKGTVVAEMIVKYFYGEFTTQGFKRYSGQWAGPPKGGIGNKDIAVAMGILKEQMKSPALVVKGGVGYGVDEMQKVADDGKGWVWIAADMTPGGLALNLFKSVPYGKRPVLVAKAANVDEMFEKVNWSLMDKRVDTTMGGPQIKQR